MTQDEIIEMYMQVSKELCNNTEWCWAGVGEPLQMFAHFVAAKAFQNGYEKGVAAFTEAVNLEREACAEIAEKQRYAMFISLTSHPAQNGTAVGIANAIRARGES